MNELHVVAAYMSHVAFVWFFFLCFFNVSYSSFILAVLWFLYSFAILNNLFSGLTYIEGKELLIMIDGAAALAMTSILKKDSSAYKYALILSFSVLCHGMILLAIHNNRVNLFYSYYDELIILTCIMQMLVSLDGMVRGTRRVVQILLHRQHVYSNNIGKGSVVYKKEKARS